MKDPYLVVLRPIISEKSTDLSKYGKYVFEIARDANKIDVRRAIEEIFKVKVKKVAIINEKPKLRRLGMSQGYTSVRKKAIVTLQPGYKIELISGV
ncbi:MAG: 50S ribosomal protein L23 [Dictyoglomaceae bacterium]|nr:50S ribosomal protein L23 [Dictyoglomaceae bacterium]